jgi:SNF2 family DNA or RNA helicase
LLLHPDSAGHGMNLQYGGNIMVFFGLTWRLESYLQAIERIGPTRQMQSGLDRRTFVHHIVARRTIDEAVMDRLLHKATVQEAVKAYMKRVNA